jgi:hypothetical protein
MSTRKLLYITASAVIAAGFVPAAIAAGVHSNPQLAGSPQMRFIDSHHAKLRFASDRLPRTASGKIDAKITFANGSRVSALRPTGTHGDDIVYTARVSSTRPLRIHEKYTVTFRLGDAKAVQRLVKLFDQGESGR